MHAARLDTGKEQTGVTHWNLISKPAVVQALFSHMGWYHQSQINTGAKQSRVEFLRQCCSFPTAHNTRARSVVASLLFQAGKRGKWWNEDLPKALENWRQMMVHCIRQALADEQEQAVMGSSSRDICFPTNAGVAGWNLYTPDYFKNNMQDMFWSGNF